MFNPNNKGPKRIKPSHVEKLIADGYCRVSRKYMVLARIDRPKWREYMAKDHAPWDVEGEGMKWASSEGMADHYRRCYSQHKFEVHPDCAQIFRQFPASHGTDAPQDYRESDQLTESRMSLMWQQGYTAGEDGANTSVVHLLYPEAHDGLVAEWLLGHSKGAESRAKCIKAQAMEDSVKPVFTPAPHHGRTLRIMTIVGSIVVTAGLIVVFMAVTGMLPY